MRPIKSLLEPKKLLVLSLVYTGFATLLFLLPGKEIPDADWPKGIDKFVHVILIGALFLFWALYGFVKNTHPNNNLFLMYTALACMVYGIVIEVLQENFIPLRQLDWADVFADMVGVALGIVLYYRAKKVFETES